MSEIKRRKFLQQLATASALPLAFSVAPLFFNCASSMAGGKGAAEPGEEQALNQEEVAGPGSGPEEEAVVETPAEPARATLMAVGDIMMHQSNINRALIPGTNDYDFVPYFEYMAPVLSQGDFVLGNLETTLAGRKARYTGYPMFNAPDELAPALKQAGFTMLTTANNHSLDRREKGVLRTKEVIEAAGLDQTGTFSSWEDRERVRVLRKNGISLAVLAYTYGTNGIPIPKGREYLVNLINEELIAKDIEAARALDVDFIACCLHFGNEYQRRPDQRQKALVDKIFNMGADVVLGSHPHVLQPYEVRRGPQGDQVVIYSMGNFIANQMRRYTELGVVFKMELQKDPDGSKRILAVEGLPTRIVRLIRDNRYTFRVLPLERTLAQKDQMDLPPNIMGSLERDLTEMNSHLRSMLTDAAFDRSGFFLKSAAG